MAELAQLFAHIEPSQRPTRDDGLAEAMRIAEALLFAAAEPLAEKDIEKRMPRGVAAGAVLAALKADYASRGINLVRAGGKWMFRTAADLAWLLATGEGEVKRLRSRRLAPWLACFVVVLVAEFGDLTQLATAALVVRGVRNYREHRD